MYSSLDSKITTMYCEVTMLGRQCSLVKSISFGVIRLTTYNLGKSENLFEPQFSDLQNGDNNNTFLIRFYENEIIQTPQQRVWHIINISCYYYIAKHYAKDFKYIIYFSSHYIHLRMNYYFFSNEGNKPQRSYTSCLKLTSKCQGQLSNSGLKNQCTYLLCKLTP